MTSVALVSVVYGDKYRTFLPEWCDAVAALERAPDEIILVTDDVLATEEHVRWLPNMIVMQATLTHKVHPQFLINDAIYACESDWVCKMDVDDLIYPHALNPLDTCEADVYGFGIRLGGVNMPAQPATAEDVLRIPHNLIFSGSPFRKWVWLMSHFQDVICEDWRFWINAANNGASFQRSSTIDYEYRIHGKNISMRGDLAEWEQKVRDYQRMIREQ